MVDLLLYVIIGILILLVGTGIYIGHLLYKRRGRKDIENGGKIRERELELDPLPDEKEFARESSLQSSAFTSKGSQSSLENSSIILLSQEKERKSLPKINSKRNSKSLNKIVKSSPKSLQFSKNGSMNSSRYDSMNDTTMNDSMNGSKNGSKNGSRKGSIDGLGKNSMSGSRKGSIDGLGKNSMSGSRKGSIDGLGKSSMNGSRKSSTSGSRYSRGDVRINSLFIDIPNEINEIPPPPPPSPLKSRDDSVESFLNMVPSDISDSTCIALIPSKASSPILSRSQSKLELKAQPTSQGDCPEV